MDPITTGTLALEGLGAARIAPALRAFIVGLPRAKQLTALRAIAQGKGSFVIKGMVPSPAQLKVAASSIAQTIARVAK